RVCCNAMPNINAVPCCAIGPTGNIITSNLKSVVYVWLSEAKSAVQYASADSCVEVGVCEWLGGG
ncbi:MAG: hypothetical protein ACKO96_02150, partial [Flammeovirgaceae bacterium]